MCLCFACFTLAVGWKISTAILCWFMFYHFSVLFMTLLLIWREWRAYCTLYHTNIWQLCRMWVAWSTSDPWLSKKKQACSGRGSQWPVWLLVSSALHIPGCTPRRWYVTCVYSLLVSKWFSFIVCLWYRSLLMVSSRTTCLIRSIHRSVTRPVLQSLVASLVLTWLD